MVAGARRAYHHNPPKCTGATPCLLVCMARKARQPMEFITFALVALSDTHFLRVGEAAGICQCDILAPGGLQLFHGKQGGAWVQTEWGSWAEAWQSALFEHFVVHSRPDYLPIDMSSDTL